MVAQKNLLRIVYMQVSLGSDLARCSYCVHATIAQYAWRELHSYPQLGPYTGFHREAVSLRIMGSGWYWGASVQGIWNRQLL